jgi:hypothetical protein
MLSVPHNAPLLIQFNRMLHDVALFEAAVELVKSNVWTGR